MVLPHPLQEQTQLLLSGAGLAAQHLVRPRDAREDVEDEAQEVHLGVGGAGVEGLGKVRGDAAKVTWETHGVLHRAPPREGVVLEQGIQELTNHKHRRRAGISRHQSISESVL